MSRIYRFALLSVLVIATLACGLITNPINQAQGLASTAQAMASSMPIETLQAMASAVPPGMRNIPNIGNYLNPTGKPASAWNNIPIMSQATTGQEYDKNTYAFKTSGVVETDIQTFYNDKLKTLGWSPSVGLQGGEQGGFMLFTKDNQSLTIVIAKDSSNNLVVILLLE